MTDTEALMKAVLTADGDRRARALQILETGQFAPLPDPLLTTNQLCERLQVSRATLWRWNLPCIHRGGVRRYQWGNVLAAIAQTPDKPAAGKARK